MKWVDMLEASPEALSEHYRAVRNLAYNNSCTAQHRDRTGQLMRQVSRYLMRQVSMCEAAAKRRGIRL
jgi:hypothetical protein